MAKFENLVNVERTRDLLGQLRSYVAAFVTTFFNGRLINGSTKSTVSSRSTTKVAGNSFGVELDSNGKLSVNIGNASTTASGLMSSTDKTNLAKKTERVYVGDGIELVEMDKIDGTTQAAGAGTGTDTETSEKYLKLFGRLKLKLKSATRDSDDPDDPITSGGLLVPLKLSKSRYLSTRIPVATTSTPGLFSEEDKTKLGRLNLYDTHAISYSANYPSSGKAFGVVISSNGYLSVLIPYCSSSVDGLTSKEDYVAIDTGLRNLQSTVSTMGGAVNGLLSWKTSLTLSGIAGYQDLIDDINADIDEKVSTLYKPKGSMVGTGLVQSLLDQSEPGWVYNVTEAFTTSDLFVEGAGKQYPAGTNVVVVTQGSGTSATKKFDVLAGFVEIPDAYEVVSWSPTYQGDGQYRQVGTTEWTSAMNAWHAGRIPILALSLSNHTMGLAMPLSLFNSTFMGSAVKNGYLVEVTLDNYGYSYVRVTKVANEDDFSLATATAMRDLFNTDATATSGNPTTLGTADATATINGETLPALMPVAEAAPVNS